MKTCGYIHKSINVYPQNWGVHGPAYSPSACFSNSPVVSTGQICPEHMASVKDKFEQMEVKNDVTGNDTQTILFSVLFVSWVNNFFKDKSKLF